MWFVVVHESMFGNTRMIADAIAASLREEGHDVRCVPVADLGEVPLDAEHVLVIGAPTHAHTLPGSRSRIAAGDMARKSNPPLALEPAAKQPGVREWLDGGGEFPARAAVFDTRVKGSRFVMGSAAVRIARRLRRRHTLLVLPPQSFFVRDNRLLDGETERASAWAREIARSVTSDLVRPGPGMTRGAAPRSR